VYSFLNHLLPRVQSRRLRGNIHWWFCPIDAIDGETFMPFFREQQVAAATSERTAPLAEQKAIQAHSLRRTIRFATASRSRSHSGKSSPSSTTKPENSAQRVTRCRRSRFCQTKKKSSANTKTTNAPSPKSNAGLGFLLGHWQIWTHFKMQQNPHRQC